MATRRTNKGQVIDFDALPLTLANVPAVGNTGTDGKVMKEPKQERLQTC